MTPETQTESLAKANAAKKAWDDLLTECWKNNTQPTSKQVKAQWEGITDDMIHAEIAQIRSLNPKASVIWLIPCYYMDNGEKTVSGSISMPSSDLRRRQFSLNCHWEENVS